MIGSVYLNGGTRRSPLPQKKPFECKILAMPKSTRKTRSTTHSGKSQRVEVFIKKEEDTKTTYDNSSQHKLPATWNSQQVKVSIKKEEDTKITLDSPSQQKLVTMTTLDSTVKDEDGDTKILLAKVESEKGPK